MLPSRATNLVGRLFQHQAPGSKVGAQPSKGLTTKAGVLFGLQLGGILALSAASQRRGAGGVVAVRATEIICEFRLGCECLAIEAGGGGMQLPTRQLAQRGEGNPLG